MTAPVLELTDVTKSFAGRIAVESLSLEVPEGSLYGLLGPNGAGKTTSIRMILNILRPDSGRIRLFGVEAAGRDMSARIGYLPEERGLYKKMKVLDMLVFFAETKGVDRKKAKSQAGRWLERLGLGEWAGKSVNDLSKGMQQKVQFISTLLHDPDLVILDEPFSGLDPVNSQAMQDTVIELVRSGVTVLFSTHIMEHAEKLCDHVSIIARGKKILDGPLTEVKRRHGGKNVILAVERGGDAIDGVLADRSLVLNATSFGQYSEVELQPGCRPDELLRRLVAADAGITRFEVAEPTLHKIFVDLVGAEALEVPA